MECHGWFDRLRFETLEVFKSENMKSSNHSFSKAMSFKTLLIYKWSKYILHSHQFQILNRDEIISWRASFREFTFFFTGQIYQFEVGFCCVPCRSISFGCKILWHILFWITATFSQSDLFGREVARGRSEKIELT